MKWTPEHDLELVKEMLAERPFDYPKGSREIGTVWKKIVSNLNAEKEIQFNVNTIRAVRDRYQLLEVKFKRNVAKELNASGIDVEPTEFNTAMEDLVAHFENQEANAEIEKEARVQNNENEKAKAEDVRLKALETFAETKKRKSDTSEKPNPRRRMVAVEYLQQKSEKEMAMKKEELELRRRELEVKEEQLRMQNQQQNDRMKVLLSLINKDNKN